MPADPTNMRDRITASATEWALMYPLSNWGFWTCVGGEEAREQIAAIAEALAAAWGRDIADRVLAELFTATDPGGDLHRQTVEHLGQAWPDLTEDPVYLEQLAHEALSVRWGHAVRQAVEVERIKALLATCERVADKVRREDDERHAAIVTERNELKADLDGVREALTAALSDWEANREYHQVRYGRKGYSHDEAAVEAYDFAIKGVTGVLAALDHRTEETPDGR